ncbi:aminotransferase class IV [Amycolatopsis rhabdoformis]|uniref:Aminotransferase class IV n=1 Tax=Amycolatopsis rhabdoformis TaxID=1448059 RepID=A0ABZ1IGG1_9PSEU|nr:aminotransferase class IV [Amycolatopsis rhabdoformis]WSE33477.1 aminotransferase class IV [Amycolatopsis rhabdoformis]
MQVRAGRVRGLDLHLTRLATNTRVMFGSELDVERVRGYLRRLVAGRASLSARVLVLSRSSGDEPVMVPEILVRTGPPHEHIADPIRLRSTRYERELPEVKHTGTFGLIHHSRQAVLAGYDDALFLDHIVDTSAKPPSGTSASSKATPWCGPKPPSCPASRTCC